MARMRIIKPEFWTDDVIVELSPWARLFYMGTWSFAICDQGHLDDSPRSLKLKILPADDVDPVAIIDELVAAGRLLRKQTPDGTSYLHIRTLARHTRMDTRWSTRCPYCAAESSTESGESPKGSPNPTSAPQDSDNLAETHANSREPSETQEKSPREGKGREGKGGKERPRQRGSRLPDDFAVTPEMVEWARERVPRVDGRHETEKFRNHWKAASGANAVKRDWAAAWRNWLLKAAEYAGAPNGTGPPAVPAAGPIPADERCPDHRAERRDRCRQCAALRKGGDA